MTGRKDYEPNDTEICAFFTCSHLVACDSRMQWKRTVISGAVKHNTNSAGHHRPQGDLINAGCIECNTDLLQWRK